jgi:hypothetical protein
MPVGGKPVNDGDAALAPIRLVAGRFAARMLVGRDSEHLQLWIRDMNGQSRQVTLTTQPQGAVSCRTASTSRFQRQRHVAGRRDVGARRRDRR